MFNKMCFAYTCLATYNHVLATIYQFKCVFVYLHPTFSVCVDQSAKKTFVILLPFGFTDDISEVLQWRGTPYRHLNEELLHLIKTDERFLHVKANIECTDLLIIDEVSMISTNVLNQLEFVCIHVRKSDSYFGNMQVVLVGDFYQLWK
jgi:ATP-dependent exoDNAse (exonuclease V) alpha subunit